MRKPNPGIIPLIEKTALALLMEKDPPQIGMRDIAAACGITAASIYHYYKDKDELFQSVALGCLRGLNGRILGRAGEGRTVRAQVENAVAAYRDWCFENPRRALLVMQGIKSACDAPPELMEQFYMCNRTGERPLRQAVAAGAAVSRDPRLDVGILVSGLWGCVESVLLKKSELEYWQDGTAYTDRFIALWLVGIFTGRAE